MTVQEKLFKIQELCEEVRDEMQEDKAPAFDDLRQKLDDAESEWNDNQFSECQGSLEQLRDGAEEEASNIGDPQERETILEWIDDMPTSAFQDY